MSKKVETPRDAINILVGYTLIKTVSGITIYLLMRRAVKQASKALKQI